MSWHPHCARENFAEFSTGGRYYRVDWMRLPAYGTLAVGWSLGDRQRLADLGLGEAERQATQFERLGELFDFVQIDAVNDVRLVDLVDGGLVCNMVNTG